MAELLSKRQALEFLGIGKGNDSLLVNHILNESWVPIGKNGKYYKHVIEKLLIEQTRYGQMNIKIPRGKHVRLTHDEYRDMEIQFGEDTLLKLINAANTELSKKSRKPSYDSHVSIIEKLYETYSERL